MVQFRVAKGQDHEQLLALMLQFSLEVGAPLTEQHISNALSPLLLDRNLGEVWVAERELLIGYLVISWGWGIESGGREALIDEVFVTSSERENSIASSLVNAAIEGAREIGAKVVFLETEAQNPRSRNLYQRLGFEVESSVWMRRPL